MPARARERSMTEEAWRVLDALEALEEASPEETPEARYAFVRAVETYLNARRGEVRVAVVAVGP